MTCPLDNVQSAGRRRAAYWWNSLPQKRTKESTQDPSIQGGPTLDLCLKGVYDLAVTVIPAQQQPLRYLIEASIAPEDLNIRSLEMTDKKD